jgi:formate hydrogenlyase subunit 3/multisubunit Na+/H+ antiporter MnhD subunit
VRNDWLAPLARIGLVAKGVSFALVGVLALEVALGHGGKSTSREGALASIAHHGWGKAVLFALAAGFAAYAVWRVAEAVFEREEDDTKRWGKRAGYAARAAIYAGLAYSSVKIATGTAGPDSQTERAHETTARILSWPAGTWLVALAGLCVVGAGLYNGYRGVTRKFTDKWQGKGTTEQIGRWATRIGVVGLLARCVVFCLIGAFAIKAAIQYQPREAIGLDGALRKLSHQAYGQWLLGLTAAGLIAYGIYCFADARYRRL